MSFRDLRKKVLIEEFDYQILMSHLQEYTNKRDKVTRLIREKKIVPVKKGLYVFGDDYRKGLICKETLANQIYGPSYISFEYALSFYGMIPERVDVVTSTTTGSSKQFDTPLGVFSYRHLSPPRYDIGITLHTMDDHHSILIASPEKALIDQVYATKGLTAKADMDQYLIEDLRVREDFLKKLSVDFLEVISSRFNSEKIRRLVGYIRSRQ